jgi:hypothetical protein
MTSRPIFMKGFREQFMECRQNGFTGRGDLIDITPGSEWEPMMPNKSKAFRDAGVTHIETLRCLKFGGTCSS